MSLSMKSQEQQDQSMKGEKDLSVVGISMAKGLAPSTTAAQRSPFLTPSPFSVEATASTGWSSRPPINFFNLLLRFFAFLFSFASTLSLVILPPEENRSSYFSATSFAESPELLYSFTVTMIAFAYSLFQLFKGILEISERGIFMSDMVSDYTTFILDQLLVYLLVSSSSAAVPAIKKIGESSSAPLWKASTISVSFSFATFLVTAICALLSGYKLCKRIMW